MSSKDAIISLPDPHLRRRSQKVGVITPQIKAVIEQMKAATLDWEDSREFELGVALAAIQIDQPLRIVIVREDFEDKQNRNFIVLINPEVTKLEGEVVEDYEGCLSVADVYGKVPRHSRVRIRALDEQGRPLRLKAEGFLARVLQHEIDHTNGLVFVDHIKGQPDALYRLTKDGKLKKLSHEQQISANRFLW